MPGIASCGIAEMENASEASPGEPPQINRSTRERGLSALQLVFPRSTWKHWSCLKRAKTFDHGQENQRGSAEFAAQDHYIEAR